MKRAILPILFILAVVTAIPAIADDDEYIFSCTDALNAYNFHSLFDRTLGDLYKSHGCLHLAPVDSKIFCEILPIGTKVTIRPYSEKADDAVVRSLPDLIDLMMFESDLEDIKAKLAPKNACSIDVYPGSEIFVIKLKGSPFAKIHFVPGPKEAMYPMMGRDGNGSPYFDDSLAGPTTAGTYYVLKKVENYKSPTYKDTTDVPMGALMTFKDGDLVYKNDRGVYLSVPEAIQQDLALPEEDRNFEYFRIKKDDNGKIVEARWGSNTFGKYVTILSKDKRTPYPELIHTSGELMMEESKFIMDTIGLLSSPGDSFDECVASSESFLSYKDYYDFVKDPSRNGLITDAESAHYRLYFDLPLDERSASALPKDSVAANKYLKGLGPLTRDEEDVLIKSGAGKRKAGKFIPDKKRILGIQSYTYQYMVGINKYANCYSSIMKSWDDLNAMRKAIRQDCIDTGQAEGKFIKNFGIKLLLQRLKLERLTQDSVTETYNETDSSTLEMKFKY